MRRRPAQPQEDYALPPGAFVGARRKQANQIASAVLPFFATGGMSYWFTDPSENFYPQSAGVQLVANLYVPGGRQGFIKELRVAPLCPSVLIDPWTSSGAANSAASWREWFRVDAGSEVVLPNMGDVWKLPFGWESAFDEDSEGLPSWKWSIRYVQGNILNLRRQGYQNVPPFDTANPNSWYLVPNIPVPVSAYAGGLPGNAAGPMWDSQRLQVLPTDKLSLHIPIPEDTTVLLFAQWSQSTVLPYGMDKNGGINLTSDANYDNGRIPPIGPSIGSLLGYTQALTAAATVENLELGWGG